MTLSAMDDLVTTTEDTSLSGNVLLDNGSGADTGDAGTTLSVLAVNGETADIGTQITLPSGALLTINADGTFNYDPNGAFEALAVDETGNDSFTYALTDGSVAQNPAFEPVIELASLGGANGFVIKGIDIGDSRFAFGGISVSSAGDVNGDGFDDVIVGVPSANPNGQNSGASFVAFGKTDGGVVEMSDIEAGLGGFVINGTSSFLFPNGWRGSHSGRSVSGAGDVNGDGFDDLIVGQPGPIGPGKSFVVFGKTDGSVVELSSIRVGPGGFLINGVSPGDGVGFKVSGAGDVNGDGLEDLIVGALGADPNGDRSGASFVVFGKTDGSVVELSDVEAGLGGFVIKGVSAGDYSGFSVSGAGDVNGDGFDDLIVGAPGDTYSVNDYGASFVVFGKADGDVVELSDVQAGLGGFVINGVSAGDLSGFSVSGAGDVNGDGFDDLIVGAWGGFFNSDSGASFVVFGKTDGSAVELSDVEAGTGGFVINGVSAGDRSGYSVSGAGDVNGDGLDDLIVGAYGDEPNGQNSGASFVVFGKSDGSVVELSDVEAGLGGFVINGASDFDRSGHSVSGAGDVNGDGFDDLIVSERGPEFDTDRSGNSYVIFGQADFTPVIDAATVAVTIDGADDPLTLSGLPSDVAVLEDAGSDLDLSAVTLVDPDSPATFTLVLAASAGTMVAGARDGVGVGGSGTATLTLNGTAAAIDAYLNTASAIQYTGARDMFGDNAAQVTLTANDGSGPVSLGSVNIDIAEVTDARDGSDLPDDLSGDAGTDVVSGFGGDDTLRGGAGNDTVLGAEGADSLHGGDGDDLVGGGAGNDLVLGDAGNDTLYLWFGDDIGGGGFGDDRIFGEAGSNTIYGWFGNDTVEGGTGSDTIYGGGDTGTNRLFGNAGDDLIHTGGGGDFVGGGAGNDIVRGAVGADTIYGGLGDDNIGGGEGNDLIYGWAGTNVLYGGVGNDTVQGGTGADSIYGGGGTNRLFGNDGDDLVVGGAGNDLIGGGAGNDTVRGGNGADSIYGGSGGANQLFGDDGDDLVVGGAGHELIGGGANNDVLYGSTGNDTIYAGQGNDFIGAGGNDDLILAGAGNNRIYGGDGNDTILAGAGRDIVTGGAGADVIVFNSAVQAGIGAGRDVITDFQIGLDRIDLSALNLTFIGPAAFSGTAGELRYVPGFVVGDLDGDGLNDFAIELSGAPALTAGDFIL